MSRFNETARILLGQKVKIAVGVTSEGNEIEVPIYSQEDLTESLDEMHQSTSLAEGELQKLTEGLEELKLLASQSVPDGSSDETAFDEELSLRLEKLRDGFDRSGMRLEIIKAELGFLINESMVPSVAEKLSEEDQLLRRLDALRKSTETHEQTMTRLQKSTQELMDMALQAEVNRLMESTNELAQLLVSTDPVAEDDGLELPNDLDAELRERLKKLNGGVYINTAEVELLKQGVAELEELALESQQGSEEGAVDEELQERLNRLREGYDSKELAFTRLQISLAELETIAESSEQSEEPQPIEEELVQRLEALKVNTLTLEERLERLKKFQLAIQLPPQVQEQAPENGGVGGMEGIDHEVMADMFADPEDTQARTEYRQLWATFRPHLAFAERTKKQELANENTNGYGHRILAAYNEATTLAEGNQFHQAKVKLEQVLQLVEEAKQQLKLLKEEIALESEQKVSEREEVFAFATKTKGKEFDIDSDAQNFFLANTLGVTGGIEMSPKLQKMNELFQAAIAQANRLRELGASPEEIGRVAMKGIPKALWPDWMIKEIEMFRRAKEILDLEALQVQITEESVDEIEETLEKAGKLVDYAEKGRKACEKLKLGSEELLEQAESILGEFSEKLELISSVYDLGKTAGSIMDHEQRAQAIEDNPVKVKMEEFQRNRAIVDTVNKLVSLGCDVLGEIVPALGVVSSGKDALLEIYNAGMYFKKLRDVQASAKGAKIDPRSAMLLPLAQIAIEKKIQLSESAIKGITSAIQTIGKGVEMGGLSAPIGIAIDKVAGAIKLAGKALITGIKWNQAEKAHKNLKKAIGPPPIRKAMLEIQKQSSKYARCILVQGALDNDPWAVRYLETIGLGKSDLDNPNTTMEIIREYITLTSGGLTGEQVGEDQERFKDSMLGKAAYAVKGGTEKVRDVMIGRSTSAVYDPGWNPPRVGLSRNDWQSIKEDAIKAGWYDNRLQLGELFTDYEEINKVYNPQDISSIDARYGSLVSLRARVLEVYNSATANDRKTPHAGMRKVCSNWVDVIDQTMTSIGKDREKMLGEKYKGMNEKEKSLAIENELRQAVEKQQEIRNEKFASRVKLIQEKLFTTKFEGPWGGFYLTSKGLDKLTAKAKETLELDDTATSMFRDKVRNLISQSNDRLANELETTGKDKFEENLKLALKTLSSDVTQFVRAFAEVAHEDSLRRANRNVVNWQPKETDYQFDVKVLKTMLEAAEKYKGGPAWDGHGSKGLKKAMEKLFEARSKYESVKQTNDPQKINEKLGFVLGYLDALDLELRKFDPLTTQGLPHNGLVLYREEMLGVVLAERMELDT